MARQGSDIQRRSNADSGSALTDSDRVVTGIDRAAHSCIQDSGMYWHTVTYRDIQYHAMVGSGRAVTGSDMVATGSDKQLQAVSWP